MRISLRSPTCRQCCSPASRVNSALAEHDAVTAAGPAGERSMRTADWSLRCEPSAADEENREESQCQLFVRPDDRWEANDVAALCRDIVESLLARMREDPVSLKRAHLEHFALFASCWRR